MTLRGFRHRVEYAAVVGLARLARLLPAGLVRVLGGGLGALAYVLVPARRRIAVRQIRAAFPDRSEAACRAIARATFGHFGRLIVELLRFSGLPPERMRASVVFEGADHLRAAQAAGRGVIVVTGHFGYWEIQGIAQALEFPPMSVLARPLDNPHLHHLVERMRTRTGNHVIYRHGALRRALRALAAGETVGILIDQHILGGDAVRVDFFDRPVAATGAVAALALRTGAAIVPIFCLRAADGRYRLVYEPPVPLDTGGTDDPVRDVTQRCTRVLEQYVRRDPAGWLWMHRRWREVE